VALTVSLGQHLLDGEVGTDHEALIAAGKALYQAKRSGRDRVAAG
jgi:PleD family two-component response regulator